MTIDERERVESISQWYLADQLEIDRMLIRYRYQSLKPFFLGSKALELGPAEGEMTRLLLQDFEHLTVVDGSSLLLQQIPDSPNLTKIHSLFETFEPKQRYHTVILEHILEHVEHPIQLLERAKIWGGEAVESSSGCQMQILSIGLLPRRWACCKIGLRSMNAILH